MPARKYLSCTVPQCANPHYALGYCRGHYMAQRNRAAAAMSTPIVPLRVALAMPAPTLCDTTPMPPAATLPPPPAWRSEGVDAAMRAFDAAAAALPPAPLPCPPLAIRGGMTTAHRAAAMADALPPPVFPVPAAPMPPVVWPSENAAAAFESAWAKVFPAAPAVK